MERYRKTTLGIALMLLSQLVFADNEAGRDLFFRSGKYFVVAGVLVILFVVLFVYLIMVDRKVSKLEKDDREH